MGAVGTLGILVTGVSVFLVSHRKLRFLFKSNFIIQITPEDKC